MNVVNAAADEPYCAPPLKLGPMNQLHKGAEVGLSQRPIRS